MIEMLKILQHYMYFSTITTFRHFSHSEVYSFTIQRSSHIIEFYMLYIIHASSFH